MRVSAAAFLALILSACGEDPAVVEADYKVIAEATCFLNSFEPGTPKYGSCVALVSKSLGAQGRRNAAIERAVKHQEALEEAAKTAGETLGNAFGQAAQERSAAR